MTSQHPFRCAVAPELTTAADWTATGAGYRRHPARTPPFVWHTYAPGDREHLCQVIV